MIPWLLFLPYSCDTGGCDFFSGTQLKPLCFIHRMDGCVRNVPLSTRKQAKSVNNVQKMRLVLTALKIEI